MIQNLILGLKNLHGMEEYKEEVNLFLHFVNKNYYNFPYKMQEEDNVRPSIFNEFYFHNIEELNHQLNRIAQGEPPDYETLSKISGISKAVIEEALQNSVTTTDYYNIFNALILQNSSNSNAGNNANANSNAGNNNSSNSALLAGNSSNANPVTGSGPSYNMISLALEDKKLYSFVEDDNYSMKVIIRDQSGKYAWRFKYYELIDNTFLDKRQDSFAFQLFELNPQRDLEEDKAGDDGEQSPAKPDHPEEGQGMG